MKLNFITSFLGLLICATTSLYAQVQDWRDVTNGSPIYENGYCDQPYVVILDNGDWFCTFTTSAGEEGSSGQHVVSTISKDKGQTWSKPIRIEEPQKESTSWVMPYITDYGRVYVFYSYNGDKVHELNGAKIREDMLGWYCFKYTDDNGATWSERHRVDISNRAIDMTNDWDGKTQIFWSVGKPIDFKKGMMISFTKIGKYMMEYSEGWFLFAFNINKERDANKLRWSLLPESDHGVRNPDYGVINAEHNIFPLNCGGVYCMSRTLSGYPTESYSYDGGKSWSTPVPPEYVTGEKIKNPRACPRIWKCKNGKYLFWYHNHGGWNFSNRNPAWISGGVERDGKIIWGQPEILFFEHSPSVRMSYPDLIEQDGSYWITETNKVHARCHKIPNEFMDMLWSQFEEGEVTQEGLVGEWSGDVIPEDGELKMSSNLLSSKGFTIDFRFSIVNLTAGQTILSSKDDCGNSLEIKTADFGAIEIVMSDGENSDSWCSDPGLIRASGAEYDVAVTVDNGPKIIQFVIDNNVNNGRDVRQYGWGRYKLDITKFNFNTLKTHRMSGDAVGIISNISNIRVYNRPLMNGEILSNH